MRIKNLFISALCVGALAFTSCTQPDGNNANAGNAAESRKDSLNDQNAIKQAMLQHDKQVFDRAVELDDPYTALYAAHSIIIHDSASAGKYLDTIAGLYVSLNLPQQAMKVADRVLAKDPDNKKMLEIKVSGNVGMGKMDEALALNKRLYEKNKELKYLFQNAYMQIQLGNLKEASVAMKQIESHPNYTKDSVEFQTDAPGQMQKVPVKAANIYLKGYLDIQNQRYQEALQKFKQSLAIYPKFFMAKKNLQLLEEGMRAQRPQ